MHTLFSLSVYQGVCIVLAILILTMALTLPMIGGTQTIEVCQNSVTYYHVEGYRKQMKEVVRILLGKEESYHMQIPLDQIQLVRFRCSLTLGAYGLHGYVMSLGFVLKDHTVVSLNPITISDGEGQKKQYMQVLLYFEEQGIKINDKGKVRGLLSLSDATIIKHLESAKSESHG